MQKIYFSRIIILMSLFFACSKYNLDRNNPGDNKATNYAPTLPTVETLNAENISSNSVKINGNLTYLGQGAVSIIEYGFCYSSINKLPAVEASDSIIIIGTRSDLGNFSSNIDGLKKGQIYYARAYARNNVKDNYAYGTAIAFRTLIEPTVATISVKNITSTSAMFEGNIVSDGGSPLTGCGICISDLPNPTIDKNYYITSSIFAGDFTCSINVLSPGRIYFVRAYATNVVGTSYGKQISFTAFSSDNTITDNDGNKYDTIKIGTQVWLKEDLKTTKYNDGTDIPNVTDSASWRNLTTPAYCWYNNDISYKNPYGALYNWYTANTGKLCPAGWHVPSDTEWTILTTYLGGESVAGGKLKEIGIKHWFYPNTGANNSSGFTALPGGYRYFKGDFNANGDLCIWWCSTIKDYIWIREVGSQRNDVYRGNGGPENTGYSVRCIMDY